jgi:hypothetical protein
VVQSVFFQSYANILAICRIQPTLLKRKDSGSDRFVTVKDSANPAFVVPGTVVSSNLTTAFKTWRKSDSRKKGIGLYLFEHDLPLFESILGGIIQSKKYSTSVGSEGTFHFATRKSDAKPTCKTLNFSLVDLLNLQFFFKSCGSR